VEPCRERIEDFIRRYGVFRVLAVAVAVLLVILLVGRVLRELRPLAMPMLSVGAILVFGGWLFLASLSSSGPAPLPARPPDGPLVENGVAAIVSCGKRQSFMEATANAAEPQTGTWSPSRRGHCTVWLHHPSSGD